MRDGQDPAESDGPLDVSAEDDIEIVPGGELGNMFLVEVNDEVKPVKDTPKNKILYKHGLYDFLHGDNDKKILSESPFVAVQPTREENTYRVWHGDEDLAVTAPPSQAEDLLRGIVDALDYDDTSRIENVYQDILNNQVRRPVVNGLSIMFPQSEVIPSDEGWVIRGLFKLTWEAEVHLVSTDLDEGSYRISGGVTKTDTTHELLKLEPQNVPDPVTVKIAGDEYTLSELEMEFMAKVRYLLDFEEHIDDPAFFEVLKRHGRGEVSHPEESPSGFDGHSIGL